MLTILIIVVLVLLLTAGPLAYGRRGGRGA